MILKPPQLTKRIIEILRLRDLNPKATLVVQLLLNNIINRKDRNDKSFHYRSVISLLLYLAGCTRPNILMVAY